MIFFSLTFDVYAFNEKKKIIILLFEYCEVYFV